MLGVAVVFRSGVLPVLESQRFRILHVVAHQTARATPSARLQVEILIGAGVRDFTQVQSGQAQ
jgi:hypothetical protein